MRKLSTIALLIIAIVILPRSAVAQSQTGFIVAAPDRGFAGNETVRDAFAPMADARAAELVFITDERGQPYMEGALSRLADGGAEEIVVLPLFMSSANPKYTLMQSMLDSPASGDASVSIGRAFGESYFAVEMLTDRLRAAKADGPVVVAGYGADDDASTEAMAGDWQRIVATAGHDLMQHDIGTVVLPNNRAEMSEALDAAAWSDVGEDATIVPLHMGGRLDAMMSVNNSLRRQAPDGITVLNPHEDEEAYFSLWMQREANRQLAASGDKPGVVFLAHGADFHWNQEMRDATTELVKNYDVEYAFSMADAPSIRRAVEKLEERGASSAVVVRVFGMPDSFLTGIERLIGQDFEASDGAPAGDHGGMMMGPPPQRLHTTLMVTTAGGLADHHLFARALFDRVLEVSEEPGKETIIIAAHGQGGGDSNQRWLDVLESLATQITAMGGDEFRDVLYQTWQEDWDEERDERIESVRSMVETAQEDDGIAIVVAARTTGYGPTDTFLEGMTYRKAPGFAPHPLFIEWLESQVESGAQQIRESVANPTPIVETSGRASHH